MRYLFICVCVCECFANMNASARLIDKWAVFSFLCVMLIINYNCCRYTQFSFEFTQVFSPFEYLFTYSLTK